MRALGGMIAAIFFTGCASVGMPTALQQPTAYFRTVPKNMVVSISENYLEKDGLPFHQGMYCKVHFFGEGLANPLEVAGDLQFVAYDRGKNGDQPNPVGVYLTPAAELAKHQKKDFVGTTYVFWLPYEPEKSTEMAVQATFKPVRGEPIASSVTKLMLNPLRQSVASFKTQRKLNQSPVTIVDAVPQKQGSPQVSTFDFRNPNPPMNSSAGLANRNDPMAKEPGVASTTSSTSERNLPSNIRMIPNVPPSDNPAPMR